MMCSFELMGQDIGALNIINVVGLESKTQFQVNGKSLSQDGYHRGDMTGGLGFQPGPCLVDFLNSECEPIQKNINLENTHATLLFVYYTLKESENEKPPIKALNLFQLKSSPSTDYAVTLLYFGTTPNSSKSLDINGNKQTLVSGIEAKPVKMNGRGISLKLESNDIHDYSLEEPGHYIVAVYDDSSGKTASVLVPDVKYSAPAFD